MAPDSLYQISSIHDIVQEYYTIEPGSAAFAYLMPKNVLSLEASMR